jgi:hypothetical protein
VDPGLTHLDAAFGSRASVARPCHPGACLA